jgi:hypothetical protein
MSGTPLQLVNGVALVLTFFSVRIVWGFYSSACFYADIFSNWDKVPVFHKILYGSSNVVLCSLNVVWFMKLMDGLSKRLQHGDKARLPSQDSCDENREE